MTPKINLTIQVDAPTPEQFERYLSANGWSRDTWTQRDCDQWSGWVKDGNVIAVPLGNVSRDYLYYVRSLIIRLSHCSDKPELEVYNEIVKQTTGVISNEN